MKLTTITHVSVDGVMQGLGGPDEDRRGGFERETLTDNLATGCGSRHGRSLVGESLDLVFRTTSEN